ncbi:hypothetical protein B1H18_15585 [Streptomyces tsukubensis]|uniref:Uncharacterized protein n=1 Tax=Streptomyces tsukubensis TaxID=83656 RepID=A0A1V4A8V8_9ACTN|nr:hypothetical protein B1H18_15585 [Streptomyces tsukubensis]
MHAERLRKLKRLSEALTVREAHPSRPRPPILPSAAVARARWLLVEIAVVFWHPAWTSSLDGTGKS